MDFKSNYIIKLIKLNLAKNINIFLKSLIFFQKKIYIIINVINYYLK